MEGGESGSQKLLSLQMGALVVTGQGAAGEIVAADTGAIYLGGRAVRTQAWASGEEEGGNSCSGSSGAQLEASRWPAFRSLELHPTM